jgi:hypothetical protein
MDGESIIKKLVEGKPGGWRKIGRPIYIQVAGCCGVGLEGYGCENMERKIAGQKIMGICRKESQVQT